MKIEKGRSTPSEDADEYQVRTAREAAFRGGWDQAGDGTWHRTARENEIPDPVTLANTGKRKVWEDTAGAACRRDGLHFQESN